MAELPTKEELEQLRKTKGKSTIFNFIFHNLLLVTVMLGSTEPKDIWKEKAVHYTFCLLRILIVIAQYPKTQLNREVANEFVGAAKISAGLASDKDNSIYSSALAFTYAGHLIFEDNKFIDAACVATYNSYDAFGEELSPNGVFFKEHINNLYQNSLLNSDQKINYFELMHSFEEGNHLTEWSISFIKSLHTLGLDFLAHDINKLWAMEPLGDHAKNYLKNLSEAITNDPIALREAILGRKNVVEKSQTVRVLLLGPGGAGKSSLRDRLLGREIGNRRGEDATIGVEYEWLDQSILHKINTDLKFDPKLNLKLWDFGGQTIFHGLHRAFLHENCVYVLVVDSRHEQAPDNWLHQIHDLTENNPHVLIVTNRYDHCDTRQNETRLIREFPDLLKSADQFFYFSCHQSDEPEFKDFIQALVSQSMDSRHQVLKVAMDVQRKMQVEFEGQTFLEALHIEELMPEHLVEKFHGTVVNHLDQLGYMIPVTTGGTNYCLKPEWAVKHAYDLIHSKALRDAEACASKITLQRMLKEKISLEEANFLIQFLESHQLCQKLDNNEYFFPDSAPANEQVAVREIQNEKEALALRFDLPFLPLGIHTRFIHQLFKAGSTVRIPHTQSIWRQGFLLECGGARASVQYQWRKSRIEIRMAGKVEHFTDILEAFDTALDTVLKNGVLQRKEIQPYVVYDYDNKESVYSIHSSAELTEKLRGIKHIRQLFPEVKKMAGSQTTINNYGASQNSIGDYNTNTQQNHQPHTEVTTDQRQQIATIVSELLKDAGTLPTDQLVAVTEVKKALEAPSEDNQARNLLGTVWTGINEIADFTKDKAMPIADFAIEHKESLGAALIAATAAFGA